MGKRSYRKYKDSDIVSIKCEGVTWAQKRKAKEFAAGAGAQDFSVWLRYVILKASCQLDEDKST